MARPSAIFTIVSANYIAFAATLMQSVRRFHPDVARFIILSDARHDFDGLDLAAELIACDELGIELLGNMKLWYSVIEFNTAVKPFTFRHLFTERGFGSAVYLDPDIQLFAPLAEVFTALEDHSLVLTPHMMKPLQDGKHPSDLSIMKSGVYNLGFAAVKNDGDGCDLVQWWCDRLFAHCRVDVPGNMFTDQRWMDLSPVFVERPLILRHPGYNVAYWNIVHRAVTHGAGGWTVNGRPLVFFHFSGIKPEDPTVFSKHQDRFTVDTLGEVAALCEAYRADVLANGWLKHNKIRYAYGVFGDGRAILDPMRRWVLRAIDDGRLQQNRPLRLGSAFFDRADEETFAGGGQLTRFAHQFWLDRPDLRAAFNLQQQDGYDGYVAWLCGESAERENVPAAIIRAARALRDGGGEAKATPPDEVLPPWEPLATDSWAGAARDVADWLRGEVGFTIAGVAVRLQRQAALLWERRTDLQRFFPLASLDGVEQFQLWALTDGMREGSILPDLFAPDYLAWLNAPSSISRLYGEVPISNGMALTRRSGHGRDGLQSWTQFPLETKARIEQAFWFAYLAPREFGWPAAVTASIRKALDAPTETRIGGYAFSRGMIAIHEIRDDVQRSFDLHTEPGRWAYLCWLAVQGAREYRLDPAVLCPGIAAFLATDAPHAPLTRIAELAHTLRDDLQAEYDIAAEDGRRGLMAWAEGELEPWLDSMGLRSLVTHPGLFAPPAPALIPHRANLAICGDWTVASGIGEDLRTAVMALDACGYTDYVIVDLRSQSVLRPDRTALLPGTPVRVTCSAIFHNADTAVEDWRILRRMGLEAEFVAAHWLWELERIPARWIHAFSFCDEVWASSEFVRSIFAAEERRPVRLLHHAVVAPQPSEVVTRRQLDLDPTATVFLFMFDFASYAHRKNPHGVIRAFIEAFPTRDERACLVIKTQNAELRPELWAELADLTDDPRVTLRDARLSRDALVGLIASANAFVSLHRSEGFGRGPAEAMLLGVPVILTGYSGTMDFTDPSCACVIGYSLVPVRPGEYPGAEGQRWADADVAEAANAMRWVHEMPQAAREMGLRGQRRVAEMLNPAKIGTELLRLLRDRPVRDTPPGPGDAVLPEAEEAPPPKRRSRHAK